MFRKSIAIPGILSACLLCLPLMNSHAKLLGYWSFDNKNDVGRDLSPNKNHGELKGGAEWIGQGKVGGALKLVAAADSYLEVPHHDSLNIKDQVTLMCWVQFANAGDLTGTGAGYVIDLEEWTARRQAIFNRVCPANCSPAYEVWQFHV